MSLNEYSIEYARTSRASCKNPKCRLKISPGELRIGKTVEGSTQWYHVHCMFETFTRVKPTTKIIATEKDFKSGWDHLKPADKEMLRGEMARLRTLQLKQNEGLNAGYTSPPLITHLHHFISDMDNKSYFHFVKDLAPGETLPDRVPVGSATRDDRAEDLKRKSEEMGEASPGGERKSARLQARASALGLSPASSVAGPMAAGERAEGRGTETLGALTIALNQPKASVGTGLSAITILTQDHRKVESVFAEFESESDLIKKKSLLMELLRLIFVHDYIETKALYPAVKEALGSEDPLLAKSLHDHTTVRAELNILGQSEISDPRTIETAKRMFSDLSAHVKEEEEKLFPRLQEKLGAEELAKLGSMLLTLKTQAPLTELFMQTEGISAVAALAAERALLGDLKPNGTASSASSSTSSAPALPTSVSDEQKEKEKQKEKENAANSLGAMAGGAMTGASAEA